MRAFIRSIVLDLQLKKKKNFQIEFLRGATRMKKMKTLCLPVLLSSVDAIAIRPSLLPAALRAPSLALWRRPQPDAPPSSLAVPLMEDDEEEAEQQQQQQQQ